MKALLLAAMLGLFARPSPAPDVTLWRLDCGSFVTHGLTDSCYLIRHGRTLMLWDAGLGTELIGHPGLYPNGSRVELQESLVSQLARIGVTPDQVAILALSHKHGDHIDQAADFPHATLLIGKADWDALTAAPPPPHFDPRRLAPWIGGGSPRHLVEGDYDVFGDRSVVMIATPGHTAGHHSLLVRLRHAGPILLTGDLYSSAASIRPSRCPGTMRTMPPRARAMPDSTGSPRSSTRPWSSGTSGATWASSRPFPPARTDREGVRIAA
jgi:glyoxylase-like metal-dependent hydrolase (beta-lactamase superfamily II)